MTFGLRKSNKWISLAIASFLMVGFALSLQALPPLFDFIDRDIKITNSEAGTLMGVYAIPGIFLPFIISALSNRISLKKLLSFALIIIIAGLISFSFSTSFLMLLISRITMGIGATMIVVLSPLLITMNFDSKSMGLAMGVFNIAVPVGTVLASNLFGGLGSVLGWRFVMIIVSIYLLFVLAFMYFALVCPNMTKNTDKQEKSKGIGNTSLWALAFIWCFANAQALAYTTFGPQFFQLSNISSQHASFLTSLVMFVPIFLSPVIGIAFDKTGFMKQYLLIGSIISLLSYLLLAVNVISLPVLAFFVGVGFSPVTVFVFSFLPLTVSPHEMGLGLGMLTIASNLGTTLGPMGIGAVLDLCGNNFAIPFYILSAFSLMNILLSFLLKSKK